MVTIKKIFISYTPKKNKIKKSKCKECNNEENEKQTIYETYAYDLQKTNSKLAKVRPSLLGITLNVNG